MFKKKRQNLVFNFWWTVLWNKPKLCNTHHSGLPVTGRRKPKPLLCQVCCKRPAISHPTAFWAPSVAGVSCGLSAVFFCCVSASHPTFRFCLWLRPHGNGLCGRRRKTWLASPGWKRGCLLPSRPDLGGPQRGAGWRRSGLAGFARAGHRPQPGRRWPTWVNSGYSSAFLRNDSGKEHGARATRIAPGSGHPGWAPAWVFSPSRWHSEHPGDGDLHPAKCHRGF